MLAKLICYFRGHKRGVRVYKRELHITNDAGETKFYCPRCNATWSRKAKGKA